MDVRDYFVDNLKKLMIINGKSQSDLVVDLNFRQNTVSNWMNGKMYPRAEAIQKLSEYFGVSISDLIGENKGGISSGVVRVNVYNKITSRGVTMKDVVGFIDVPSRMTKQGDLIALRVKGDAMTPKIDDDDIVIIQLQKTAETGDIVVFTIGDDDAIIRKFIFNDYGMTFIALNSKHEPMFFSKTEIGFLNVKIIGKVIESRRKF